MGTEIHIKEPCYRCRDTGFVHTRDGKGYERLYRCFCEAGKRHSTALFSPLDKEKERPIEIPVYRDPAIKD